MYIQEYSITHVLYMYYTCIIHVCVLYMYIISLQGTLIQHLKEHILHGNMTSKDVIFYYTTVSILSSSVYTYTCTCIHHLISLKGCVCVCLNHISHAVVSISYLKGYFNYYILYSILYMYSITVHCTVYIIQEFIQKGGGVSLP